MSWALIRAVACAEAVKADHLLLHVFDYDGECLLVERFDVEREVIAGGKVRAVVGDDADKVACCRRDEQCLLGQLAHVLGRGIGHVRHHAIDA